MEWEREDNIIIYNIVEFNFNGNSGRREGRKGVSAVVVVVVIIVVVVVIVVIIIIYINSAI